MLALNRIYTKRRGVKPDLSDPLIVKQDASIEAVVSLIPFNLSSNSPFLYLELFLTFFFFSID